LLRIQEVVNLYRRNLFKERLHVSTKEPVFRLENSTFVGINFWNFIVNPFLRNYFLISLSKIYHPTVFFVFRNRQIVQKAIFSRNYVFPGVNHWPFPRKLGHCKKEQKYFEKIEIHYSLLALFRVDVLIRFSC